MITLGLDVGTGATKAVLLEDGETILYSKIDDSKGIPKEKSTSMINHILEVKGIEMSEIDYIASTGYGRYMAEERQIQISDLTTTGRGANFIYREHDPRIILDIGNQSTRTLKVDERGKIILFKMNERCAAGSGRFIERCSKYLVVPMEEVSELAMKSLDPKRISSVCAVLSETEIINEVSIGTPLEDIMMGVFSSIADRAATLLHRVKMDADVFLTGGLVHMEAMKVALEKVLDYKVHVDKQAHAAAALGAAMLGYQRATKLAIAN